MKALIIGGNRFFGRQLAKLLIDDGASVTLLNRGHVEDGLGSSVERIHCDRTDSNALESALQGRSYDVVFDQVCYDAREARAACRIFKGKTPLYVFTSTVSVYRWGAELDESKFDPRHYSFTKDEPRSGDYGEAKRQAEAVFFQEASFRVIAPRFPIVCGEDDYTGRLLFHVDHVKQGKPMYFPSLTARMSYISSIEAGACLKFLAGSNFEGPINCSSPDALSMQDLLSWIETAVGKPAQLAASEQEGDHSPYGVPEDFFPGTRLLQSMGLRVRPLEEWLPGLIKTLAANH